MRFLLLLLVATSLHAATKYVAQAAAGSNDGSSAGNAYSIAQLNAASPYSPAAGDTVIFSGTITTSLTVPTSGSAGNVITYLFATGAKFSKGTWGASGAAILISGKSYITIDGGATGTIGGLGATGTPNGIIECTSNGTGLTTTDDTWGVRIFDGSNVTVQGMTIKNIYVRIRGTDAHEGGAAVSARHSAATVANITVTNCVFSDMQIGFFITYGPSSTAITYSYCTAYNINWGGGAADGSASDTLSALLIDHCYFHDFINWDGTDSTSQGLWHHNGYYGFAENSGTLSSVTFSNNTVGPNWSTGAHNSTTAGFFSSGSGVTGPVLVFNNTFIDDVSSNAPSNGHIFVWPGASTTRVMNNTFVGNTTSGGIAIGFYAANAGAKNLYVQNNIVSTKTAVQVAFNGTVTLTANHNDYYALLSGENFSWSTDGSGDFKTLAQWQAIGGAFDPDGVTATPNLNGSYVPQPTSAAIDSGTSLSTYFTTDAAGLTRPQGSAWDMGAYEYPTAATATSGNSPARSLPMRGFMR